ncbi:MAG: hypothetical protein ASUL_08544 [Candidatus Aramenus sulfurataquae]|jgi:hypothetical protein|uniref:Uncharacterized protein n=2 Tax=Candidatus Aramenus sulfurataquae TaxID=1326980 RepID=W7KK98_9CREN|nr:MAG: hypothetical protein ASUL_08544 [Candidatus Aramenus sulfurataquae]MCL7343912.1 hypothetical protein [Candidatus Aramenus sulfurataquae]
MMEEYTHTILLKTPKSSVYSVLTDPHVFAGISGHIAVYKVFDRSKNDYVPQGSAIIPENKFKTVFVFHDQEGNVHAIDGVLEGPIVLPNMIEYRSVSDDGKMKASFQFEVKEDGSLTNVRARVALDYDEGFFSLFSRDSLKKKAKWYGNMAEHLLKMHFAYYLEKLGPQMNFNLKEVDKVSGDMREILLKLRDLPKISAGYLVIRGEGFKLLGKIVEGVLQAPRLKLGSEEITGEGALGRLFLLSGKAEMRVYVADIDEAILERL